MMLRSNDPMIWVAVAFLIFIALAYWKGRRPIAALIDQQIEKIRAELERATGLRVEAEARLATYQQKYKEAMAEAEDILRFAKEEAVNLKSQAEAELMASLARLEQQAAERIALVETEALAHVRMTAVEAAVKLARANIGAEKNNLSHVADRAIGDLTKVIAAKDRAA